MVQNTFYYICKSVFWLNKYSKTLQKQISSFSLTGPLKGLQRLGLVVVI